MSAIAPPASGPASGTVPGGPDGPVPVLPLGFDLADRHLATAPIEASGARRDQVRLMVSDGDTPPVHTRFDRLAEHLSSGDLVVVNNSGTRAAAIDGRLADGSPVVIHVSTGLPGGLWTVEPRRPIANGSTEPFGPASFDRSVTLVDGTALVLLRRAPDSNRLWLAVVDDDLDLTAVLDRHGRPIRYRYVDRDWPIEAYQSVFATHVGSAEMPSAARPFTHEVVTSLIRRGVTVASITLHTGVSSLEGQERPYAEWYSVPEATAALVNATRRIGGRVIAIGTTVVRALESAADGRGVLHPARGWTDLVITPRRGVAVVDGLLTGWHEPEASHLAMLEAVAGRGPLLEAYGEAWAADYRWHEFGDSHLLLRHPSHRLTPPVGDPYRGRS